MEFLLRTCFAIQLYQDQTESDLLVSSFWGKLAILPTQCRLIQATEPQVIGPSISSWRYPTPINTDSLIECLI